MVVDAVSDTLQRALAEADDARLAEVAVPWPQIEEFYGHAKPENLAEWLRELAALARRSLARSEHLCCGYAALRAFRPPSDTGSEAQRLQHRSVQGAIRGKHAGRGKTHLPA